MWFDVRKCPLSKRFSEVRLFGAIFLKHQTNFASSREIPAKMESRITWKQLKIGKLCQRSMNINLGSPFQNPSSKYIYTAPLSGDITPTSFPVCKKTSLSSKRCMKEVKLHVSSSNCWAKSVRSHIAIVNRALLVAHWATSYIRAGCNNLQTDPSFIYTNHLIYTS